MVSHSKKDIETLIAKYLEKKCTKEEKQQLYELLTSFDDERSFKEVLFSKLNEFHEDQNETHSIDFDRIFNKILSEIRHREIRELEKRLLKNRNKVNRLVFKGISIAAVFCIAFFLGTFFNGNNGKTISKSLLPPKYNEIKAPHGAKSIVKLVDGTEVMLNAGSTIKYLNDYNSFDRNLILEGEAYFKVAKNLDLPLVVNAGSLSIRATGTEFNVKAYSEEGIVETTLIEGRVEISQTRDKGKDKIIELEPNQKAIYTNNSDQMTLERIMEIEPMAVKPAQTITDKMLVSHKTDVDQVTAWTKNKLIIRGENLESLCIKLQRKYDVTFVFNNEEIKKYRFSGVLLDETFQQVMDVIKLTAPIDYLLEGKVVTLISNKDQIEKYLKRN